MKRKLESDGKSRFFKKLKTSDESNQTLVHKLILAASSYAGKLKHISSSGYYVSYSFLYTAANDFVLNFCDSIGDIPGPIKQAVSEKFTASKNKMVPTEQANCDDQPHLSCWEFCFLALKDIGLVSEKQLDDLCYIVYKINEKSPTKEIEITLAHALFNAPLENYRKFSKDSLPAPGDFLLFQKNHASRPYHCSICIDKEGGFIGLNDDECVKQGNVTKYSTLQEDCTWDPEEDDEMWAPESVYYVPVSEIARNIQHFIETYQNIIALKKTEPRKTEEKLLEELGETQYEQLVSDIRIYSGVIP
ncbi:hypothetical protein [Legionella parisiensis]|uniref:Uncharacterized protein n=1 Tax=Legionella parisiensis TaxID=45071 RepID=A0A1E5JU31_9GAMM|nr:hypothetical protein [Legionella parisiensis]KTD42212.1 hypothetical protein Lpar_3529 [Legionella parisiensis]OEH48036.1 hypothetical protein lpari_00973 [Legionella parisiensis]STX72279.1 Uncharacterised protein [Legionella parisiensis]